MSSPPTSRKRGRYHHGNLPAALVDAALEVIAELGAEALTLREVASRVGVTHAAPYRHYKDKAALLAAVADDGFVKLQKALETARMEAAAQGALGATALAYLRFAHEHAAQYQLMFATGSDEGRGARRGAAMALVDEIRMALRRTLETAAEELTHLARLLLATWHGLAQTRSLLGLGDDEVAALATRAATDLARRRRPSSPTMRSSELMGLPREDEPAL